MNILKELKASFLKYMKDERGFLQALLPLLPSLISAGGAAATAFTKDKPGAATQTANQPAWQQALSSDLGGWAQKFLKLYNPGEGYQGAFPNAKVNETEQMGLDELKALMSGPATGELFGAGKQQLLDTLSGKFSDPGKSPFIQNYTKLAAQNLRDAKNESRRGAGARGNFFSKAAIQEESNLDERTQNMLNALIGDFTEKERGRQFSAAPIAKDFDQYENLDAPIKRITASQTLGGLPRALEQEDFENRYKDYIQKRTELMGVPGIAQSAASQRVPMLNQTTPGQTASEQVAPWLKLATQSLPLLQGLFK